MLLGQHEMGKKKTNCDYWDLDYDLRCDHKKKNLPVSLSKDVTLT